MRPRPIRTAALAAAVVLCTPAAASAGRVRPVELGESLWAISMRYRVPIELIMKANDIRNPYLVSVVD